MEDIFNILSPNSNFDIHSTEYHQEILDQIANAGNAYIDQYDTLYQCMLDNTVITKYSKGGKYLSPFGYYHPTTVMDHYAQNVSRGRLLSTQPENGKCTYIYYYDSDDQLLAIESGSYFIKRSHEKNITFVLSDFQRTMYIEYWKKPDEDKPMLVSIAWAEKTNGSERFHIVEGFPLQRGFKGHYMWTEILSKLEKDEAICESFKYSCHSSFLYESFLLQYNEKGKVKDIFMTDRKAYRLGSND